MEKTHKNINKLMVLRGLPASGKSTFAVQKVKEGFKRVSKDDLRAMIDNGKWNRENEKIVVDQEKSMVFTWLRDGYNVVVDDTNFGYEEVWKVVADTCNVDFELINFDTLPGECIERDRKRGDKSVGAEVIMRMYNQHVRPKPVPYTKGLPDAYIFDIDGTLAIMGNRSPYDFSKVSEDKLNEPVANILDAVQLMTGIQTIIMSGREDLCRDETEKWLEENDIKYNRLLMRPTREKRKDSIIKKELYEKYIKGQYNVLGVIDDRRCVVEMWRHEGLPVFQCDYGEF